MFGKQAGVDEFTNMENELIFPVVAVPLDAAEAARAHMNGVHILEPLELLVELELKIFVELGLPVEQEKCCFDDLVM